MKIRIKGNSIRLRLSKTDVRSLAENGSVTEQTIFGAGEAFSYALETDENANAVTAKFHNGGIVVKLPLSKSEILTNTSEMGVEETIENGEEGGLFILIEKDLQCTDSTREDQSDMYENVSGSC